MKNRHHLSLMCAAFTLAAILSIGTAWAEIKTQVIEYKQGDTVKGVVIKFNKYGALASIEEGVAGLVHVSEFGTEEKLRAALELGKVYPFLITLFEPKDQRMTLSFGEKKAA